MSVAQRTDVMTRKNVRLLHWGLITASVAIVVTLVDVALLQRTTSFFTGGFLSIDHLTGPAEALLFFVLAAITTAALVGPLCAIAVYLAAKRGGSFAGAAVLGVLLGACPLFAFTFANYELWRYLGDAFDLKLFLDLSGGDYRELAATAAPQLLLLTALVLLFVAAVFVVLRVLKRRAVSDGRADPGTRGPTLTIAAVTLLLIGLVTVSVTAMSSRRYDYGLRRITAGQLLGRAANGVTDIDRDGYGLLRPPRDSAAGDASVHPYAVEIPGNGIDEDGVAGDLPAATPPYVEPAPDVVPWLAHPPVVFITLESVRADAVGATLNGRPVTAVMDALARTGIRVDEAYSHNGYTAQSRYHILTGSLAGLRRHSLLDDFKRQGYEIAYVAGGNETFGGMPIDLRSVDFFYDARQDVDKRFSAFATAGSLAVPATLVEERIRDFVGSRRPKAPLFLYVNLQDTHFPYYYSALRPLIDPTAVQRHQISAERREDLRRMYLNTVANVDRTIGRIIDIVRAGVGRDPGVVIVSDHGESLFEEGFLGHGYALNDVQTRVPLVIANLPVAVTRPFGQAQLRDAVTSAIAALTSDDDVRQPTFVNQPNQRVFQYIGVIERPSQVAFLEQGRRLVYDFRRDRLNAGEGWKRPAEFSGTEASAFRELVFYWEALRLAQAKRTQ